MTAVTHDHPHLSPTWGCDHPEAKGVSLRRLSRTALDALAVGDLPAAQQAVEVRLTDFLLAPTCRSVWARRSRQVAEDPDEGHWVTRLVVAADGSVVGRAGFHGAPQDGMVAVGYEIDPSHRRQGYARASLLVLLDVARREPEVHTLRATIRPDNTASRALVVQHGLLVTGEQWDEEDGLETIFEVDLG